MDTRKYRALFVDECREHLQALSRLLVELEASAQPSLEEIFRHIHSVKGMAASMGYEPIAALAHGLEDVLAAHRGQRPAAAAIDLLLRGVDALMAQVNAVEAEAPVAEHADLLAALRGVLSGSAANEPVPMRSVQPVATEAPGPTSVVRVAAGVLDDLINTVGELFIARSRLQGLLPEGTPELEAALAALAARTREIHAQVMAVRMTPLRTLTDRYPRMVRDLARSLGKDASLQVEGSDLEVDRTILDGLDAPLVHVLRNAVDHGLESPDERAQASKPREGRVLLTVSRDRDAVMVCIADDGRGLDPVSLCRAAIERELITADEAEAMSAREAYFLICAPGFSTKPDVSNVSGRGVGMDVVRSTIEGLGGSLDIASELGRGTSITFRLPLTLAIIPVLMVSIGGRSFAMPAAKVVAVREPADDIFEQAGGQVYLSFQHALVRIVRLGEMLGLEAGRRIEQVVVLEDGRDLYAVAVDGVQGYQEVVVKPLGEPLARLEVYSGAAVLGDGQPILILDLPRALRGRFAA